MRFFLNLKYWLEWFLQVFLTPYSGAYALKRVPSGPRGIFGEITLPRGSSTHVSVVPWRVDWGSLSMWWQVGQSLFWLLTVINWYLHRLESILESHTGRGGVLSIVHFYSGAWCCWILGSANGSSVFASLAGYSWSRSISDVIASCRLNLI